MAANDAASLTTIADLPDECLREVMLGIPIQDRINLRKVCKKWREVSDDCWSAVRSLMCVEVIGPKFEMRGCYDSIMSVTSSRKRYEGVMKRCGRFLTDLVDHHNPSGISLLPLATKYCHNIKELSITVSSKADDKHMNQLLAINLHLQSLRVSINFKNAKMCLRTIATNNLQELNIGSDELKIFPPSILRSQKQIVRKASSLKKLETYFVDEELIGLIGQKVGMEVLTVTYCGNSLQKDVLYPILNLKNLRELTLSGSLVVVRGISQLQILPITDDFLVALVQNLQLLHSLALTVSPITDRGFAHLASLPKLIKLEITYCPGVTDKSMNLFSRLEELNLMGCKIRDEGVIELLGKTQTLREIQVSHTRITNKTLIAAVEETKKRGNGVVLKLHVWNTDTTPSSITDSSPFLEIIIKEP